MTLDKAPPDASPLLMSYAVFWGSGLAVIVISLVMGMTLRMWLFQRYGTTWFEQACLAQFAPVTITAVLLIRRT